VGPRNHVLDGGQDRTNPFAARGITIRRCGLLPNYCEHLFVLNNTFLHFISESPRGPAVYYGLQKSVAAGNVFFAAKMQKSDFSSYFELDLNG